MARSKKKSGKVANYSHDRQGGQCGASKTPPEKQTEKPRVARAKHAAKAKHTIKKASTRSVVGNGVASDDLLSFPGILQCQRGEGSEIRVLVWKTHEKTQTRRASEEAVLPLLYRGVEEFGLSRQFSNSRKLEIRKACRRAGIPLLQALSLRRSYMKNCNPTRSMPGMGLASYQNIRAAAALFEDALIDFLRRGRIPFYSEQTQRNHFRARNRGRGGSPPTPDILLQKEIKVRKQHDASGKEHCVCWMDAKMFYGASSIGQGCSAVGNILQTARKYVSYFGPGAFVFYYGCGHELAEELLAEGVLALDCSKGLSLEAVREHQRTWCAARGGEIWP